MNHNRISGASHKRSAFHQHLLNKEISPVTPMSQPTSATAFCSYTSQPKPMLTRCFR